MSAKDWKSQTFAGSATWNKGAAMQPLAVSNLTPHQWAYVTRAGAVHKPQEHTGFGVIRYGSKGPKAVALVNPAKDSEAADHPWFSMVVSTPGDALAADVLPLVFMATGFVGALGIFGLRFPILGLILLGLVATGAAFGIRALAKKFLATRARRKALRDGAFTIVSDSALKETLAFGGQSWLSVAQNIAALCARDDKVADVCGQALRNLLWEGRRDLGTPDVAAALTALHTETVVYWKERVAFEQMLAAQSPAPVDVEETEREVRLSFLAKETQRAVENIQFESEVTRSTRIELAGR